MTTTLQFLHASDLEGGVDAIDRAPNFAALVDALEDDFTESTLVLSGGDNVIPGPFFNAALFADDQIFSDAHNTIFDLPDASGEEYQSLEGARGRIDLSIMNAIGFDASALGNHEFDLGTDTLNDIIEPELGGEGLADDEWPGTTFPYLSANLDFSSDPSLADNATTDILTESDFVSGPAESASGTVTPRIAPAATFDVENTEGQAEKVGVIGATTQLLAQISSPGQTDVLTGGSNDMTALAEVLQPVVDDIRKGEDGTLGTADDVNKVVLVSHLQQLALEEELIGQLSGVDVVVASGSDTLLADNTDTLRPGDTADGSYPIVTQNADGDPAAIVSTDGEYSYVGRLVVDFDENGVLDPASIEPSVSGAFASTEEVIREVDPAVDTDTEKDGIQFAEGSKGATVQNLVDGVREVVNSQDGNTFGQTDVFLDGRRSEVRTEETNLGNLTADANLAVARQADESVLVSLKNGGGIRAPIGEVDKDGNLLPPQDNPEVNKEAGEVSQLDITNSLRFNNGLTLITVTPDQLIQVLEHAVSATASGATPGQFAQLGGARFTFDPSAPAGERLVEASITPEGEGPAIPIMSEGERVEDAPDSIRLVTLNFLANGGDGYPFPEFVQDDPEFADRVDLTGEDADGDGQLDSGEDRNLNGKLDGPVELPEGAASFAPTGSEQDALAEYMAKNFAEAPFSNAETPPGEDTRIVPLTSISEIQGRGHVSPFVLEDGQTTASFFENLPENTFTIEGDSVVTRGVVTAVDGNGFYLQDPTGDGDPATADGLFVFTRSSPSVAVGDNVEVGGTVAEFFPGNTDTRNLPTTELVDPDVEVLSSGNDLPAPAIIGEEGRIPPSETIDDDAFGAFEPGQDGIDFFESLEGTRVTAQDTQAVAPTNRFGEIFSVVDQGESASGISARGTLNIAPQDFNPEKVQIDFDRDLLSQSAPEVTAGAKLGDVTGVVNYDFGNFQITPTEPVSASTGSLTPETSELRGDATDLTAASYNVLNLDPNDDDGDQDLANGRFDAIADQVVTALNTPDVIALQEVQDNDGAVRSGETAADETLQTLVDAIAATGGPEYEFIDTPDMPSTFRNEDGEVESPVGGQPGGNIRNAFLYNPDRVDVVEDSVRTLSDGDGDAFPYFGGRIPLEATFRFNGEDVTFLNNHFSSKSGSAPILGTEQPFTTRQEDPTVNGSLEQRQDQATGVADRVNELLSENPDANVSVLGDLNEFEFGSPVSEILGDQLTNLVETLPADERYSFIFQGNSQALDHMLTSDGLTDGAEFDIVHTNSEFADTSTRASDHDPLLARFNLPQLISGGEKGPETVTGTPASEVIRGNGGPLDILTGSGGDDTFDFDSTISDGERDFTRILDWSDDQLRGISPEDVVASQAREGTVKIAYGEDPDILVIGGSPSLNSLDDIFGGTGAP